MRSLNISISRFDPPADTDTVFLPKKQKMEICRNEIVAVISEKKTLPKLCSVQLYAGYPLF
jgi:hypothetical protein